MVTAVEAVQELEDIETLTVVKHPEEEVHLNRLLLLILVLYTL